jgi:GAF domain-containing protein
MTINRSEQSKESRRNSEPPAALASLYEMALALAGTVELDETLRVVLRQVHGVLDYDLCFITLASMDGRRLVIQAADSTEGAQVDGAGLLGMELAVDHGINAWIYREGQPTLIDDADQDPRRLHVVGLTESIRSVVGVPLIVDGQPIGTLYAARCQPCSFDEAHLHFLTVTAAHVAAAVQRARLLDQARKGAREMGRLAKATQEAFRIALDERDKLVHLHRVAIDMQRAETLVDKLQIIADGIHAVGWGRAAVSTRDADLNAADVVCAGFTLEDEAELRASLLPGSEWRNRFGGELERFRLGGFYYLPWSDPWVRETARSTKSHRSPGPVDTWDPRDLLYMPLLGRVGRIMGIISLDDPDDGRRPTAESLQIIELFAQGAALTIENAQLVAELRLLNADLQEMVTAQAQLLYSLEQLAGYSGPRKSHSEGGEQSGAAGRGGHTERDG